MSHKKNKDLNNVDLNSMFLELDKKNNSNADKEKNHQKEDGNLKKE